MLEESRRDGCQLHMRIPLTVRADMDLLAKDQHRTMTTEVTLALKFYIRTHRRRLERIAGEGSGG